MEEGGGGGGGGGVFKTSIFRLTAFSAQPCRVRKTSAFLALRYLFQFPNYNLFISKWITTTLIAVQVFTLNVSMAVKK